MSENSVPCMLGHCFVKYKLVRDVTCGRQQPLWQKQVTVIGSVDLDSQIDEHHTGVAQFRHAICQRRSVRRQEFCADVFSLFFVAADADSQSFWEFFSVANVSGFSVTELNEYNTIQQLFWAAESRMAVWFNQFTCRRLFNHFKPRSWWKKWSARHQIVLFNTMNL